MEKKVLIVILNYLTYEFTLDVIEKVQQINYSNMDILVVDNCSPNESAEVLEKEANLHGKFIFIKNSKNTGYASGNNIGIRYGINHGYEYSWILNNDIQFVDKNILKKLVDVCENDASIACVGPMIEDLNGNIVAPFVYRPTRWNQTLGIPLNKKRRIQHKYESGIVYRVYGCCMLLKNSYMEKVNCFDERTFLYCEEDILAEKFRNIGAKTYYCSNAKIVHLESMTVKRANGTKNWNKTKLVLKSYDIYLKEYRKYGKLSRLLCEFFRGAIVFFRE